MSRMLMMILAGYNPLPPWHSTRLVSISIFPLGPPCPLTSSARSREASQEETLERPRLGRSTELPLRLTARARVDSEMRTLQSLFVL